MTGGRPAAGAGAAPSLWGTRRLARRPARPAEHDRALDVLGGSRDAGALAGARPRARGRPSGLAGLTSGLYRPASAALLTDLLAPGRRITGFALYRLAINLGYAAGPATAGFLAERSFFLLFLGDAITSALFGVAALVALPEGVRASRAEEQPGELVRAVRADRAFQLFLLASHASAFVYFQQQAALPLHVADAGHSYSVSERFSP